MKSTSTSSFGSTTSGSAFLCTHGTKYYLCEPINEKRVSACASVATFGALLCVRNYGAINNHDLREHFLSNVTKFPEIMNHYGHLVYESSISSTEDDIANGNPNQHSSPVNSPVEFMEYVGIVNPVLADEEGVGEEALEKALESMAVGTAAVMLTSSRHSCDGMLYAYLVYKHCTDHIMCYDPHPLIRLGAEISHTTTGGKALLCVGATENILAGRHRVLHGKNFSFYMLKITQSVFDGQAESVTNMFTLVDGQDVQDVFIPPKSANMGAQLGDAPSTGMKELSDIVEIDADTVVSCMSVLSNWEISISVIFLFFITAACSMVIYKQFNVALLVLACVLIFLVSVMYEGSRSRKHVCN